MKILSPYQNLENTKTDTKEHFTFTNVISTIYRKKTKQQSITLIVPKPHSGTFQHSVNELYITGILMITLVLVLPSLSVQLEGCPQAIVLVFQTGEKAEQFQKKDIVMGKPFLT